MISEKGEKVVLVAKVCYGSLAYKYSVRVGVHVLEKQK